MLYIADHYLYNRVMIFNHGLNSKNEVLI